MTLKEFVVKRKMTEKELSEIMGVSITMIKKWEDGKSTPGLLNAMKLVLISKKKIKPEDLLSIKDKELWKEFND